MDAQNFEKNCYKTSKLRNVFANWKNQQQSTARASEASANKMK